MGSWTRFGAVSGDWGYRERRIGESKKECCGVWWITGRRKESYNVGVPTDAMKMIYYSYVHSVMSYSFIFWGNSHLSGSIFKVQK